MNATLASGGLPRRLGRVMGRLVQWRGHVENSPVRTESTFRRGGAARRDGPFDEHGPSQAHIEALVGVISPDDALNLFVGSFPTVMAYRSRKSVALVLQRGELLLKIGEPIGQPGFTRGAGGGRRLFSQLLYRLACRGDASIEFDQNLGIGHRVSSQPATGSRIT